MVLPVRHTQPSFPTNCLCSLLDNKLFSFYTKCMPPMGLWLLLLLMMLLLCTYSAKKSIQLLHLLSAKALPAVLDGSEVAHA